jgi:single-strand DNA-binding protein
MYATETHGKGHHYGKRHQQSIPAATADRQKDGSGNWSDKTEWHNLVAFNRTAEVVRDYVKKGTQLFIEGKIQTRSWDDKESSQKKYRTEILVNELTLLGGRQSAENGGSGYGSSGNHSRGTTGGFGQSRPATGEEYTYTDQGITSLRR